jgi:thiol:disulfide interchange protein DsbD
MMARALALAIALIPQPPSQLDPVRWSLSTAHPVVRGATLAVKLSAAIQPGWHLYSIDQPPGGPIATEISLPAGQPFTFSKPIVAPKPHAVLDPGFDMLVRLYSEKAEFGLLLKVDGQTPPGAHTLRVDARYQSCNDSICLPPRTATVTVTVQVREK